MKEEKRIYVVVAETVQVIHGAGLKTVVQPAGRQIAQACHVVSKLRHYSHKEGVFEPSTTIILSCRDSNELFHILQLATKAKLVYDYFGDTNTEAYGAGNKPITALAFFATSKQVSGISDYLPLWGCDGNRGLFAGKSR